MHCATSVSIERFERHAGAFGDVLRGLSTLAESLEDCFQQDRPVRCVHPALALLDRIGKIVLAHFAEEPLRGFDDFVRCVVAECRHANEILTPPRQAAPRGEAKLCRVIRVRVPLDLHAVAESGSGAFALATPLRVRDVLSLAVRAAIGERAPAETFARSLRMTLAGLSDGRFIVVIDGRRFQDIGSVVLCRDVADVRFFLPARSAAASR